MRNLAEVAISIAPNRSYFIGECGTGKTHLLTGLCEAALRVEAEGRFYNRGGAGQRARRG